MLSGVTAGVIGIDASGRITIANRMALQMLETKEGSTIGEPVVEIIPQLEPVVTTALRDGRPEYRDQIVNSAGGRERSMSA